MRRVVFIIAIAAVMCAACTPIGSVYENTQANDQLWVVPYRVVYDMNHLFKRQSDLAVFTSSDQGELKPVPLNKVQISIAEDPNDTNAQTIITPDEDYQLQKVGRKIITIKYGTLAPVNYSIEVQDPYNMGNGNGSGNGSGNGNNGGDEEQTGIIVDWRL
ncbi:MAG: hypothetical protein LBH20_11305 [Treponema sp.]|jgi:hypothetical protein|nr:hypothetical protein [Treponema sp.]